jgi:hypothetical protein
MCYQVTEVYSVCKCLYFQHAVDRCPSFGQAGHQVQVRMILVGYSCSVHLAPGAGPHQGGASLPDSLYSSSQSAGAPRR